MVLGKFDLIKMFGREHVEFINENSIDVRLGEELKVFSRPWYYIVLWTIFINLWYLDKQNKYLWKLAERFRFKKKVINLREQDTYYLKPGEFALAHTFEHLIVPREICCNIKMKSSRVRENVNHLLGTQIETGFNGEVVMELHAVCYPFLLRYKMRIAQIIFVTTSQDESYDGNYQGQTGARESKMEYNPFNFPYETDLSDTRDSVFIGSVS